VKTKREKSIGGRLFWSIGIQTSLDANGLRVENEPKKKKNLVKVTQKGGKGGKKTS